MIWTPFATKALVTALLAGGAVYGAKAFHDEQMARQHAEDQQKASEEIIKAKDQAIADRDKQFQQYSASIDQQIAALKNAKQATAVLQPIILPQGGAAPATVTKSELPASIQSTLPGAPNTNYTLFSDDQMVNLGKFKLECDKTTAGLTTCQADKADLEAKFNAKTLEATKWEEAAKGGTRVQRFLKIAVPVGCAGAGAALGSVWKAKGAFIGAATGGTGCALTLHF